MAADTAVGALPVEAGRARGAERQGQFADPVFVLCNARSGSTLLRFILDEHPELACPPETNLPNLCAQLATVWSLIEGAPLSPNRGDEPPAVPEAAITGVRETMDRMVGSYLDRRGKKRYCDKSLGTARFAELLVRVYPEARFVCMYRHPMDVIASGMEACPWGLNGYGFDPYIAATPGNAVMALASFWADNTHITLTAEERFPSQCYRLRYEDLVADPEETAAKLFAFLGVDAAPGISERCFSGARERFGPSDHKIWYTSGVSPGSVGRGWSVPVDMIAPQALEAVNEMAGKLGYLTVDAGWGTTEPPDDLRAATAQPPARSAKEPGVHDGAVESSGAPEPREAAALPGKPLHSRHLGETLRAGLAAADGEAAPCWGEHAGEKFVAVTLTRDPARPAEYWLVDLGERTVTLAGKSAQEDSDWDVIGPREIWEKVIARELNLSAALRSCALRYCDNGDVAPLAGDTRMAIVGQLLGLAVWQ
jgi:hypothetical protein